MALIKRDYDTDNSLTITIDGLASDASLLAGRCSLVVDNSSTNYLDVQVSGKMVSNGASLAGGIVEIFAWAYVDSTDYTGSVPGTDSNFTIGANDKIQLRLIGIVSMDTRINHPYAWGPTSIASAFSGIVPVKWGIFTDHNTGSNLGTGNSITYKGSWLQTV